ncbi:tudor domain-containing protein 10 isoform X3 [Podarcis raffonei]|uniref:tudor domain-containing protein 10 isoform X3 n=1 Tax=Podarcis raffonei TaxID=65483 RepID=UPI0023292CD5|nr:tudor domain-containing protein 10 isoform X3 [Podarcis raffonei]
MARVLQVDVSMDPLKMSNPGNERNNGKTLNKHVKAATPRHPGSFKKKESELFVGNLPLDIKETELALAFREFGVKTVKKHKTTFTSFGFLELASADMVKLAIKRMNGSLVHGRRITVAVAEDRRAREPTNTDTEMPDLEPIPSEETGPKCDLSPKANMQTLDSPKLKVLYAIPMEMRTLFLLQMLADCFKDVGWLFSIAKVVGKAALLVLDTVPQTPFFWAIHLTEECHQAMRMLFGALAESESCAPFLTKKEVQQGTRCLAECIVGDEGYAWNRCWVVEKVEDLAVVFFVDFGRSATVPLNSLRKLDRDDVWAIKPLAQPFALQEEVFPPQLMMRKILEGKVVGPLQTEQHILKFAIKDE